MYDYTVDSKEFTRIVLAGLVGLSLGIGVSQVPSIIMELQREFADLDIREVDCPDVNFETDINTPAHCERK